MTLRTTSRRRLLVVSAFALGLACGAARGERLLDHFVVRQWTQDNGLPSDQIEDLELGPDGFLWLAADRALYRFDGAISDLLMHAADTSDTVASFTPLAGDRALVSLLSSVYICHAGTTNSDLLLLSAPLGANLGFVRCPDGEVWGIAQAGVVRYAGAGPELFPAPGMQSHSPDSRFHGGCADSAGRLWLVAQSRLLRFDPATRAYEEVDAPKNPDLGIDGFERIFAGREGRVWLYLHPCHLFVCDGGTGWQRVETGYTSEQRLGIRTLLETGPDEVWFGTESAVHRINRGVRADLTASDLGAPLYPSALLPSESGGVWVALRGAGLLYLRPRAVRMFRAPALDGRQPFYALSPLTGGGVRASIAGQGLFSGPIEHLSREQQTPLLQQTSVAAILCEPGGVTWYATLGNYLIRQQDAFEETVAIEYASPLPTWNVTALARTRDGVLWAASPNGLFYVEESQPPPVAHRRQGTYGRSPAEPRRLARRRLCRRPVPHRSGDEDALALRRPARRTGHPRPDGRPVQPALGRHGRRPLPLRPRGRTPSRSARRVAPTRPLHPANHRGRRRPTLAGNAHGDRTPRRNAWRSGARL